MMKYTLTVYKLECLAGGKDARKAERQAARPARRKAADVSVKEGNCMLMD